MVGVAPESLACGATIGIPLRFHWVLAFLVVRRKIGSHSAILSQSFQAQMTELCRAYPVCGKYGEPIRG